MAEDLGSDAIGGVVHVDGRARRGRERDRAGHHRSRRSRRRLRAERERHAGVDGVRVLDGEVLLEAGEGGALGEVPVEAGHRLAEHGVAAVDHAGGIEGVHEVHGPLGHDGRRRHHRGGVVDLAPQRLPNLDGEPRRGRDHHALVGHGAIGALVVEDGGDVGGVGIGEQDELVEVAARGPLGEVPRGEGAAVPVGAERLDVRAVGDAALVAAVDGVGHEGPGQVEAGRAAGGGQAEDVVEGAGRLGGDDRRAVDDLAGAGVDTEQHHVLDASGPVVVALGNGRAAGVGHEDLARRVGRHRRVVGQPPVPDGERLRRDEGERAPVGDSGAVERVPVGVQPLVVELRGRQGVGEHVG